MSHRPTVTEVVAKLQTCGSADQIAQFFEREGVVGRRDQSRSCAVANYVTRETGQIVNVSQSGVWGEDEFVGTEVIDEPLAEFITNFDNGRYPGLVI